MAGRKKNPRPSQPAPAARKRQKMENQQERMTLEEQIEAETVVSGRSSRRTGKSRGHQEGNNYVDAGMTNKILREARKQQLEIEKERDEEDELAPARKAFAALATDKKFDDSDSEEDEDDGFLDNKSEYNPVEDISEEDERLLAMFTAKNVGPQRTLADMIMEKLGTDSKAFATGEVRTVPGVDQKVIEVYQKVGELLSRYTAGKLPKAFKIVVHLKDWEHILYLMKPENWSCNAMYHGTRIFASNLNSRMAQRFYELVLLPRVRQDIRNNKRLHFALYQALKKAVYKPAAFYKGILFPLCKSGCTLREAVIVGSVIQKVSIPAAHSSVAIMRIAEMEYSGTNSYFLKLLLDKKYALPYRVLDAVAAHFINFKEDQRDLPVIWHQSLLTFVQRYKDSLTEADKEGLKQLMHRQNHHLVTPEIRRELEHSLNRGQKKEDVKSMIVVNATTVEDVWNMPKVEVGMDED